MGCGQNPGVLFALPFAARISAIGDRSSSRGGIFGAATLPNTAAFLVALADQNIPSCVRCTMRSGFSLCGSGEKLTRLVGATVNITVIQG